MDLTALKPARIMLVEDSEGDVYIFKRAVADAKILNEVTAFRDGREAIKHLRDENNELPGIIFLDINMPVMSGFDVLRQLKATDRLSRIPVVMLTISQEEEDIIRSYDYGAVSFITKTVRPENLLDIVSASPGLQFVIYEGAR
ncbi:MAG: response regulator [Deltaproteobacteria bacterium]|nr:response regulator [Deltaproteobacteria bacterium]